MPLISVTLQKKGHKLLLSIIFHHFERKINTIKDGIRLFDKYPKIF